MIFFFYSLKVNKAENKRHSFWVQEVQVLQIVSAHQTISLHHHLCFPVALTYKQYNFV